jgi:uridine kinase
MQTVNTLHLTQVIQQAIKSWEGQLPKLDNRCLVIAIAGESGSGKTTLAQGLHQYYQQLSIPSLVLHQDDYFHLPPAQNHAERVADIRHVGPQEVRLDWIDKQLHLIKSNAADVLEMPSMNWQADREERIQRRISGVRIVIVEGTYVLNLQEPDYRIFLSSNYKETYTNRLNRNREQITPFIEQVLSIESTIIQQQRPLANLILGADFHALPSHPHD